jgi:hypothetical protein
MTEAQVELLKAAMPQLLDMPAEKIAEALETMDGELGLDLHWGRGIPDPQEIYEHVRAAVEMAKLADGVELPMADWEDACSKGVLSVFEPSVARALRQHPQVLQQYEGTPVMDHVMQGLADLGYIELA